MSTYHCSVMHCRIAKGPKLNRRQCLRQALAAYRQQICTSWTCLSTRQVLPRQAFVLSQTCRKALHRLQSGVMLVAPLDK